MNQDESATFPKETKDAQNKIRTIFSTVFRALHHPAVAFILFFIIMLVFFGWVTVQEGDDVTFSAMHLKYTLPEYLTMRYQTWSGRFSVETLFYYFTGPLLFLWKWLCALSITVSAFLIYHFVTFARKMEQGEKLLFAYLSCLIIGLMSSANLIPSVFWITGALNYLVPFTVGLIAFIPFFHSLKDEAYSPKGFSLLYLIPAVLTVTGAEQISLVFTCFSLIVLVYLLVKKRKISRVLWGIFIVSLIFQVISLTAPGNAVRFSSEINTWFPAYSEIPLLSKIILSLNFLLNTMINQWYYLLPFLWLITGTLLLKNHPSKVAKVIAYISYFYAILMGLRFIAPLDSFISQAFLENFNNLFHFHYLARDTFFRPDYFVPYLVWIPAILLIPISIYLIFKKTNYSLFYVLIYLAAMASIILITFSPTIYASGGRTSYVPEMLLALLILLLLRHEGISKDFALPMILIALFQLMMLYSSWLVGGYKLNYGVLNYQEIPFMVIGR